MCLHPKWAHIDNVAHCGKWRAQFMAATCRIWDAAVRFVQLCNNRKCLHCCSCCVDLIVSGQKWFAAACSLDLRKLSWLQSQANFLSMLVKYYIKTVCNVLTTFNKLTSTASGKRCKWQVATKVKQPVSVLLARCSILVAGLRIASPRLFMKSNNCI